MDITRTGNKSVLPEIRPVDYLESWEFGNGETPIRPMVSEQSNPSLRHQSGSEGRGGSYDGNANMTCKSCLFMDCSGRAEGVWCERYCYEPGSDEIESKENAMSPAPKATAWTDGLERC